jgi:diketogulonate reductase-like aldo/keto reductase
MIAVAKEPSDPARHVSRSIHLVAPRNRIVAWINRFAACRLHSAGRSSMLHFSERMPSRLQPESGMDRREALRVMAAGGAFMVMPDSLPSPTQVSGLLTRAIPSSGERIPIVGLGSWITFNVGDDPAGRLNSAEVIRRFLELGGRVIDSSPMYGSSQEVIGSALTRLGHPKIFCADKVWTSSPVERERQIVETQRRWGVPKIDLLQVHNLDAWEKHLPRLFELKSAGQVRYVGVTTSHGRRTAETEQIMRTQPVDFVQVSYNAAERELDQRLLPLAAERGIAVIINRPFQEGSLIRRYQSKPVPAWAREIDCTSWPQFLLKYVVSHPAVTCAIPATTSVAHVAENMGAARGRMPDAATRVRMLRHVESL